MKISEWVSLASKLDIKGLEWYAGFLEMRDKKRFKVRGNDGQFSYSIIHAFMDSTLPIVPKQGQFSRGWGKVVLICGWRGQS